MRKRNWLCLGIGVLMVMVTVWSALGAAAQRQLPQVVRSFFQARADHKPPPPKFRQALARMTKDLPQRTLARARGAEQQRVPEEEQWNGFFAGIQKVELALQNFTKSMAVLRANLAKMAALPPQQPDETTMVFTPPYTAGVADPEPVTNVEDLLQDLLQQPGALAIVDETVGEVAVSSTLGLGGTSHATALVCIEFEAWRNGKLSASATFKPLLCDALAAGLVGGTGTWARARYFGFAVRVATGDNRVLRQNIVKAPPPTMQPVIVQQNETTFTFPSPEKPLTVQEGDDILLEVGLKADTKGGLGAMLHAHGSATVSQIVVNIED